jgi:hypothetical protein
MNSSQEIAQSKLTVFLENPIGSEERAAASVLEFLNTHEKSISQSIDYLASDGAKESMKIDPYWPKWNSPWWHMTLLYELGLAKSIPYRALKLLEEALEGYLHFFPATEAEIPEGRDPIADIVCHCALGTAHRILLAADVPIDKKQPWMRSWFLKYQLPDGGYNCDESAYARANGKSSMVSTIHIMESLLAHDDLSDDENQCLDRSADYLLKRNLFRSQSKANQIIDPNWILLTFPRFYEIDILRAFRCILQWAIVRKKNVAISAIDEVFDIIKTKVDNSGDSQLVIEREFYSSINTRIRNVDGTWQTKQPVTTFDLLLEVGQRNTKSSILTKQWNDSCDDLIKLQASRQLV